MYETFEHTADLGLRIRAGDVDGLFEEAARALFSVLTVEPKAVRPAETLTVSIAGTEREDLLYDWLAELLYIFDARHMLLVAFDVHVDRFGLTARSTRIDTRSTRKSRPLRIIN
jgi:SHS2 domain-containing protein